MNLLCVFSLVSLNHPKFLQRVESLQVEVILDHCKRLYSNQKKCNSLQTYMHMYNFTGHCPTRKCWCEADVVFARRTYKSQDEKKSLFKRNCNADVYLVYSL
jgi:hypothetical protein